MRLVGTWVQILSAMCPFLMVGWASAAPGRPGVLTGSRPNIVIVMTDDQGYGELGCHGNPVLRTPNLDRLHAQSLRFTAFHVSPTCSPTRAALLTGRHEFRSGVTHTILERERLSLDAVTLADVLRGAGYATGIFGKWHLGDETEYLPDRRGFGTVFIHGGGGIGQSYPGSCGDVPGNRYHDPIVWQDGHLEQTRGYCTDVFMDRAIHWIRGQRAAGRPFLAYITPNAPHAPHVVPSEDWVAPYRELGLPEALAAYYAMIGHFDAALGRLLGALDERDQASDTLVVFLTDNGHSVAEGFNAGMRGTKGTPYEGGTRVPCFWRWPGRVPAGVDCAALTAHLDVFPTLAALAGADPGPWVRQIEGRSLVPLLEDPSAPWPDRLLVTHVGRWDSGEAEASRFRSCAIRDARFKLVDGMELYDLANDPAEREDVSGRHPDVVDRLRVAYGVWWDSVLPSTRVNEWALGPYLNPFAVRWWNQSGQARAGAQVARMDPSLKFIRPRPRF